MVCGQYEIGEINLILIRLETRGSGPGSAGSWLSMAEHMRATLLLKSEAGFLS